MNPERLGSAIGLGPRGPGPRAFEVYHEHSKLHRPGFPEPQSDPNVQLTRAAWELEVQEMEVIVASGGKTYPTAPRIALPDPAHLREARLRETLEQRRSSGAHFPDRPPTLEDVSSLLHYAYGINPHRTFQTEDGRKLEHRYVPSAGRLFPLELYLVGQLEAEERGFGAWHYEPRAHALEHAWRASEREVAALFSQPFHRTPPLTVFLTGLPSRLAWKYGERAYRYLLLEAGHVAQNLVLVGTCLGIATCPVVSFYDDAVHDLLDLDGVGEVVLYAVIAARSSDRGG
jgi:SagB-type dehydrogenase family enzyme